VADIDWEVDVLRNFSEFLKFLNGFSLLSELILMILWELKSLAPKRTRSGRSELITLWLFETVLQFLSEF
jgi:hypothetical protein